MISIPLADIKAKIKEQTSLSEEDINSKIQAKLNQLSGLISEEGAAHIVANENGVKLVQAIQPGEKLQVKNILAGMRNIEVVGKVTRKYELREFSTEKRSGKLASFVISDETGYIRVLLWNDQTDKFDDIKEGDTIKIENGYVRDNNGRKEIHLNDSAKMTINPEGVVVQNVQESVKRKKISEIQEGDENIEILGTIVQAFDIRFFEIDPETGRRVTQREGKFYAGEKEIASPGYGYVMNLIIDDGSDNIRTVLWRNQIQKLLDMTNEELIALKDSPDEIKTKMNEVLGHIVKIVARVNKNDSFDRLELVANLIYRDVNPEDEIKKLKEEQPVPAAAPVQESEPQQNTEKAIEEAIESIPDEVPKEPEPVPAPVPVEEPIKDPAGFDEPKVEEETVEDNDYNVEEAVLEEEKKDPSSIDDLERMD